MRTRPDVGFNTCNTMSRKAACCRCSCLFCTRTTCITSLHHISNSKTPREDGPDVRFNTCNEMSNDVCISWHSGPVCARKKSSVATFFLDANAWSASTARLPTPPPPSGCQNLMPGKIRVDILQ